LVVACNTASAIALDLLCKGLSPLPVIGVVEPGAAAGCEASQSGHIAVIATESTVRGGAYESAICRRRVTARVTARACPLFVALAEEGLVSGPIVEAIAHRYLDDIFATSAAQKPDTLVLGCTHFPVLTDTLRRVLGGNVAIVDSAQTAALALEQELERNGLRRADERPDEPWLRLLATDGPERFARVGGIFLGQPLNAEAVELVDLG
jgi:glutamate racemase